MWSIVAALIQTAHDKDPSVYPLRDYVDYEDYLNPTQAELKQYRIATSTLPAIAGLVGATLRVVNSFMVAICGTRMHNTMNSIIAMFPMFAQLFICPRGVGGSPKIWKVRSRSYRRRILQLNLTPHFSES